MHNPRPLFFNRSLAREQTQMIARRDLLTEVRRLCSNQPRHGKQLFRGNHLVRAPSWKLHWKPQAREVDRLSQGDEAPYGQFVALV